MIPEAPAARLPVAGPVLVALLTALTALGSLSVSVYVPSLPAIAAAFAASPDAVRATLTDFLVVFAASQLVYGPVSDRFGRRPVVLAGVALYVLGSLACAVAGTLGQLVAARIVQAAGASAGPALGRAVIRDLLDGPRLTAALAAMATAIALSPALGPAIGGALAGRLGWRADFWVLAGFGAALLALSLALLPESHKVHDRTALRPLVVARHYGTLLADRLYVARLAGGGLIAACNFVWTAGAPFVLVTGLGVSPEGFGLLTLLVGLGYVAGTLAVTSVLRTAAPARVLHLGGAIGVAGGAALLVVALALPQSVAALVAAMAVVSFAMGLVVPVSAAGALSRHPEATGSAAALLGAGQIALGAASVAALGVLPGRGAAPLAGFILGCALLSLMAGRVDAAPGR